MKSILQDKKECYLCRIYQNVNCNNCTLPSSGLEKHHVIYGTANRKLSEKHGLTVWLCPRHHRGAEGPHQNRIIDLSLKGIAQREFEMKHTRTEFIQIFGKSWL